MIIRSNMTGYFQAAVKTGPKLKHVSLARGKNICETQGRDIFDMIETAFFEVFQ